MTPPRRHLLATSAPARSHDAGTASKAASEVFLRLKTVTPLCEVARRGKRGSTLRTDSFSLPEKVAADLPIVEAVTERETDGCQRRANFDPLAASEN